MTQLQESLKRCKIKGNTLFLPDINEGLFSNYAELKNALLKSGAKYKRNTFVFDTDAQPYIDRLMNGDKVNLQKEFQFFSTPDDIAYWLVELSDINETKQHGFGEILEPSAGQGAIIKAIHRATGGATVYCYELMPLNHTFLNKIKGARLLGNDFLLHDQTSKFDHIIANPPFSKNQDIYHIRKMYDCLKPGGTLVSIASKHWQNSKNKKEVDFKNWLEDVNAEIYEIEKGRFKESGTMISCCVVVINKQ